MNKKIAFGIVILLAVVFGFYPITYFTTDLETNPYLNTKPISLVRSLSWSWVFAIHIVASGVSLVLGWMQFVKKIRLQRPTLHRYIGRIYFLGSTIGGITGMYLAYYSNTAVSQAGFLVLSLLWLFTSMYALYQVRQRRFDLHYKWAVRSYAVAFSAISFRVWMILLDLTFFDYETAFEISTWLSWAGNLLVIEWIMSRRNVRNV